MDDNNNNNNNNDKAGTILAIIFIVVVIVIMFFACGRKSEKSSYDKLPKDQQEWIQRNYGNGQYDDIKNAMNDYNSNH